MIKFFRNIRKTLIKEGKTANYLKYAIGEIILVVIGILIALQINNWNEERKLSIYERKTLIEIKNSLQRDLRLWKYLLNERVSIKEKSIPALLKKLQHPEVYKDSVLSKLKDYTGMQTGIRFSYDKGPYESLKSIGLDRIKNDSLRQKIVRMYEVTLPRNESFIDGDDARVEQKVEDLKELLNYYEFSNDSLYKVYRMVNPDNWLNDHNFMKMVAIEQDRANNFRTRLVPLISYAESLIEKINSALENEHD